MRILLFLLCGSAVLPTLASAQLAEIFPPPPADECVPPESGGLYLLLERMGDVFPMWEFLDVFLEAMSYEEEVLEALYYLQGETFGRLLYKVSVMPEWRHVMDYFCDELGFHMDYFLGLFGSFLELNPTPPVVRNPRVLVQSRRRPGVVGLLADLQEILPFAEMRQIFEDEYESNEYVRRAVAKVKGDEFRTVAEAIEAMDEFADLVARMKQIGLDVECTVCQMKTALGWMEEECVCWGAATAN